VSALVPIQRRIEVGALFPEEPSLSVAADIFLPPQVALQPVALFCLPGGGMNRHYFHLLGEGGFSFAEHLTAQGFIVVTLDHLGVGDSSRPRDGFALTPDLLARVNAYAMELIRAQLRGGQLGQGALPQLRSVGIGHSMGAMLTVMQQAHHGGHAALGVFGFGTRGLRSALSPEELAFADDPQGARANLVRLARLRGPDPYPLVPRSAQGRELFAGESADRRGVEALQRARASLLLTAGEFSMIPGSCAPECAAVDTPVLLVLGDRDMAGAPHEAPASYPSSPDVTLLVLPATGHAHFLFPARAQLFERVAQWCRTVLAARANDAA
jgi:alpha-beta hydrolase superfamily lysophospholipase